MIDQTAAHMSCAKNPVTVLVSNQMLAKQPDLKPWLTQWLEQHQIEGKALESRPKTSAAANTISFKGRGPIATMLMPAGRDWSTPRWQAERSGAAGEIPPASANPGAGCDVYF